MGESLISFYHNKKGVQLLELLFCLITIVKTTKHFPFGTMPE